MELTPAMIADMTPIEFAVFFKGMPDAQIKTLFANGHRRENLDAIFSRLPESFVPAQAEGVSSTAQLRITGGPAEAPSDTYEIVIDDATCRVSEEPGDSCDVSLMMDPATFVKLITGRGKPTLLTMTGKLKVRGDLAAASSFLTYFDLPKA